MLVTVMFYKNFKFGHIGLHAYDAPTSTDYDINFLYNRNADSRYFAQITDEVTFVTKVTMHQLIKWHQASKFYRKEDYHVFKNNCAHAIRNVMQELFGYDMSQSRGWNYTRLFLGCGVPVRVATPEPVFLAAKAAVESQCQNIFRVNGQYHC